MMTDYAERLDASDVYRRRVTEYLAETSMIIIKLCTSVWWCHTSVFC